MDSSCATAACRWAPAARPWAGRSEGRSSRLPATLQRDISRSDGSIAAARPATPAAGLLRSPATAPSSAVDRCSACNACRWAPAARRECTSAVGSPPPRRLQGPAARLRRRLLLSLQRLPLGSCSATVLLREVLGIPTGPATPAAGQRLPLGSCSATMTKKVARPLTAGMPPSFTEIF